MNIIRSIISFGSAQPNPLPLTFNTNEASLEFNDSLFPNFRCDIQKSMASQKLNLMSLGSEFRVPLLLAPLLCGYPYWSNLKHMISYGVTCDFKEITEEDRVHDMELAIYRGNHKSTTDNLRYFDNLVADDIKVGSHVPIPSSSVKKIKHGVVDP